jgi:DNA-binding transcriptional MocR family regulator
MSTEEDMHYGQYEVPKRPVKLSVGQPGMNMLPLEILQKGLEYVGSVTDPRLLQYGDIPGYGGFRTALGSFLEVEYKEKVEPTELFVTQGVTGALAFYCSLFTQTGSTVFVEEPTYFLAINIFKQDFRLNVVSVPITPTGIDLEALEQALINDKSTTPKFLYTIPTYHNPTSYTLPHEKREALAKLAEKYDFNIVADEVYQMLYFGDNKPPLPLCYYSNRAVSIGSFSKILAPAFRLGWMQTKNESIMDVFMKSGQMDSSGGNSPVTQALVHGIIKSNSLYDNIEKDKEILSSNCKELSHEVREQLGKYVDFIEPTGGYFLWLKLKEPYTAAKVLENLGQVTFVPGTRFSAHGSCNDYIRLSFSYYAKEDFAYGVGQIRERLGAIEAEFAK